MRHATLLHAVIAHRGRQIDRPHAAPAQTHHGFGIEVEVAHPRLMAHHLP